MKVNELPEGETVFIDELTNYSEKFNIWIARKYITYLRRLERLDVVGITPRTAFSSVEIGERYGLLPSDSFHLATMKERGIKFIVTDNEDFKRVEWAVVVELEVIT